MPRQETSEDDFKIIRVKRTIPKGHEIIGLRYKTSGSSQTPKIDKLAFILWQKPNEELNLKKQDEMAADEKKLIGLKRVKEGLMMLSFLISYPFLTFINSLVFFD